MLAEAKTTRLRRVDPTLMPSVTPCETGKCGLRRTPAAMTRGNDRPSCMRLLQKLELRFMQMTIILKLGQSRVSTSGRCLLMNEQLLEKSGMIIDIGGLVLSIVSWWPPPQLGTWLQMKTQQHSRMLNTVSMVFVRVTFL